MKTMDIQKIKHSNILCLDFDDCIIPWTDFKNNKQNCEDFILEEVKKNVEIIKNFCYTRGYVVFITSSWSAFLNDDIDLKNNDILDTIHFKILEIIKELPIVGKDSFNDRILAIEILLENDNTIVCVDDLDLSHYFENEINDGRFFMVNVVNGNKLKEKLENINVKKFLWISKIF